MACSTAVHENHLPKAPAAQSLGQHPAWHTSRLCGSWIPEHSPALHSVEETLRAPGSAWTTAISPLGPKASWVADDAFGVGDAGSQGLTSPTESQAA